MTFTSNSDIYAAIHENAINKTVALAVLQVPSFFNYGSRYIASHPDFACNQIPFSPVDPEDPLISPVDLSGIPALSLSTSVDPFPAASPPIGTPVPFNLNIPIPSPDFLLQLSQLKVDFYPGNAISLPSTVPSPLPDQHFALWAQTFVGASCPGAGSSKVDHKHPVPVNDLNCFELDLYTEGVLRNPQSVRFLNANLNGLDIVGLKPDGMRQLIDCYLMYFANGVLSSVSNTLNAALSETLNLASFSQHSPSTLSLRISPSTTVPNNPAIEDDQLKLFINADLTLDKDVIGVSLGSGPSGPGYGPATSRSTKPRPGTGPADFTAAVSQTLITKIMAALTAPGALEVSVPATPPGSSNQPWGTFGGPPLYLGYQVGASLAGGTVTLQNPTSTQPGGSILIKDLTVSWDELNFTVNIDLPKISIPGFSSPAVVVGGVTIVPAINIPGFSLFGGNGHHPDISIPISIGGLESQVSIVLEPLVEYAVGNPAATNDPNRWEFRVAPQLPIFVLPVEFGPKLTAAIENGISDFFTNLLDPFPGPLQTTIKNLLSSALSAIGGAVSNILSDAASLAESIVDMITNANALGLTTLLDNALKSFFDSMSPLLTVRDPFLISQPNPIGTQVISAASPAVSITPGPPTINLQIPVPYIGVNINSSEVVIEADLGT